MSTNPWMHKFDLEMLMGFRKYFTFCKLAYSSQPKATEEIVEDVKYILKTCKKLDKPLFIMALVMDTHYPYNFGRGQRYVKPDDFSYNFDMQRKALEYIDKFFGEIVKAFRQTGRDTDVVVTSDHGDLLGETPGVWGHDPQKTTTPFHEKLFAIPFIKGTVKG